MSMMNVTNIYSLFQPFPTRTGSALPYLNVAVRYNIQY